MTLLESRVKRQNFIFQTLLENQMNWPQKIEKPKSYDLSFDGKHFGSRGVVESGTSSKWMQRK